MRLRFFVAMMSATLLITPASAQDAPKYEVRPTLQGWNAEPGQNSSYYFQQAAGMQQSQELMKLQAAWQKADDDESREKVWSKVERLLQKQFDEDLKNREKQVEAVEQRVSRLREQLGKREEMKDEIISLQSKQITMGWEGLGWTSPPSTNRLPRGLTVSPVAPVAPVSPGLAANRTQVFGGVRNRPNSRTIWTFSNDSKKAKEIVEKLTEAAEDGESKELKVLASKLAEEVSGMDPVGGNDVVWGVFQEFGDEIDTDKFWLPLGKATERLAKDVDDDDPVTYGNILDTAAHCYGLAGEFEKALKLQKIAVKKSAQAHGGTPDGELASYLEELMEELGEDFDYEEEGDDEDDSSR